MAIKTAIRGENMEMGIESQKIPKALDSDNGPRNCILFPATDGIFDRYGFLEKHFQ